MVTETKFPSWQYPFRLGTTSTLADLTQQTAGGTRRKFETSIGRDDGALAD